MSDPLSSIIDFYPVNFDQDLNGKKQDWEAIVKIPFIDETRLLGAMKARAHRLTPEEVNRNQFGDSFKFVHDEDADAHYPSSLPGFFPDLTHCRCKMEPFDLPTLSGGLSYLQGLVPGALTGKDAISGFPSLLTIPFSGALGFHGVNVFQADSRKETMVVSIDNLYEGNKSEDIAIGLVGKRTFVGYPFLQEAEIAAVSDELFRYEVEMYQGKKRVRPISHRPEMLLGWKRSSDKLEHSYSKRYGVMIGNIDIIVHARILKGQFYLVF
jgi:5'-3' exoribonuclease 1